MYAIAAYGKKTFELHGIIKNDTSNKNVMFCEQPLKEAVFSVELKFWSLPSSSPQFSLCSYKKILLLTS